MKMMSAEEARRKTRQTLKAAKRREEDRLLELQHAEKLGLQRELESIPTVYLPDLQKKIHAAIKEGKRECVYTVTGMDPAWAGKFLEAIWKSGYRAVLQKGWREGRKGDPDSGEGECESGPEYWVEVRW